MGTEESITAAHELRMRALNRAHDRAETAKDWAACEELSQEMISAENNYSEWKGALVHEQRIANAVRR